VRNIVGDPLFAPGPLGDYYLSSVEAGQDADSPCIDAGSTSASIAGASFLTTRTDNAFDTGIVDIGYHYPATPPTIEASIGTAGASSLDVQLSQPGDALGAIAAGATSLDVQPSHPGDAVRAIAAGADEAPVLGPGDTLRAQVAGADEAPVLGSGDKLSAQVTVENYGWPIWVDFYAAFVAADGTVFCITPDGLTTNFTAYAMDVLLDDGLHFGPASVFEFALNEHVIPGDYVFAAALSRAREPFRSIGPIASVQFRIM